MREYAPLFPGPYWHLGADEYRALMARDPQASYPRLAQLARQKYGTQARVQDLATGWLNDRAAVVRSLGKRPPRLERRLLPGRHHQPRQIHRGRILDRQGARRARPQEYLNEGRTLVNLNDEYLYYVLGEPNQFRYPTGERIYREWTPAVLRGTTAVPGPAALTGPARVVGGRLAIWCDRATAQTPDQVAARHPAAARGPRPEAVGPAPAPPRLGAVHRTGPAGPRLNRPGVPAAPWATLPRRTAARPARPAHPNEGPMKIEFLLHNAYGIGGTIRSTVNLATALADRHEVRIISVNRPVDEPELAIDPPG
ncbi:hypothetical protein GCM10020000_31430 [Streptomyces olivoverticillatus]